MLEVYQYRYSSDNLGYIVYSSSEAVAIDPGDLGSVKGFLDKKGLKLVGILNTHGHFDHTMGNGALEKAYLLKTKSVRDGEKIKIGNSSLEVIATPGHTEDSVSFKGDGFVITGDTLFIANVGNCSHSLMKAFRNSLDKLLSLPDKTTVYPGHDYTQRSVKRAMGIEPENKNIKKFWDCFSSSSVHSTIGTEKSINPYLRADNPVIKAHLEANGKNVSSSFECFKSFLELY